MIKESLLASEECEAKLKRLGERMQMVEK